MVKKHEPNAAEQDLASKKNKGFLVTHDKFVYLCWSILSFAKAFFRIFLNPKVLDMVDLDSIELAPTRKPSLEGVDSIGDVFYKFRYKSGKMGAFVITMEHKAWHDRYVAIQMLRYEVDVLEYMKENAKFFADEKGRLPAPYSILLTSRDCPQLDDLLTRCEGVDHGPHMRFQKVNFNEVPFEKLEGEPFLQTAFSLSRFANYVDKEGRQSELVEIFKPIMGLNYESTENWRYFFTVLLNYTKWLMRDTNFDVQKFKYGLLEANEAQMNCVMDPKLFSEFFHDELAPFRAEIAESKKQAAESKKQAAESKKQAAESKRENQAILDNLREAINNALIQHYDLSVVPADVKRKLSKLRNSDSLLKIFYFLSSRPNGDYEEFLTLLKEEDAGSKSNNL